jgi:hypothetical protein
MGTAIIGLVGVVVGGVISGGATYLLARRESRARTRASARLVLGEVTGFHRALSKFISNQPYEGDDPETLAQRTRFAQEVKEQDDAVWKEHQPQLIVGTRSG